MNPTPIPLVPFEELFFRQHQPGNVAAFFAQFDFSHALDPLVAEQATIRTCQRHRFSRSLVDDRPARPHWIPSSQLPTIQWVGERATLQSVGPFSLDIRREPAIKIWACSNRSTQARDSETPASMLIMVHHAAMDGLGFVQWFSDWLKTYHELDRGTQEFEEQGPRELPLPKRCQPDLPLIAAIRLLPGQWKSVRATFQILRRKVIPLAAGKTERISQPLEPAVETIHLNRSQTGALKTSAAEQDVSLNSLLIGMLLVSIKHWHSRRRVPAAGTHFRIMVPVNERNRRHRAQAACNHCTMINLDRTLADLETPTELATGIEAELTVIRRWKLSLNFWRAIGLFRRLPGGIRRFQDNSLAATALFTNVGRAWHKFTQSTESGMDQGPAKASLQIRDLELVAPLLHGIGAAFTAYYVNRQLRISMHFNHRLLSRKQARELVSCFRDQLVTVPRHG